MYVKLMLFYFYCINISSLCNTKPKRSLHQKQACCFHVSPSLANVSSGPAKAGMRHALCCPAVPELVALRRGLHGSTTPQKRWLLCTGSCTGGSAGEATSAPHVGLQPLAHAGGEPLSSSSAVAAPQPPAMAGGPSVR